MRTAQKRSSYQTPDAAPRLHIVDYEPRWHEVFRSINRQWIETYFTMEEADFLALDHPDEKILRPGGHILIAVRDGEAVGTCALIRMDQETFELAKMGVLPHARGHHVGLALGQAALQWARQAGARKVYLESNSRLQPAIHLYEKLGFRYITGHPTPYARCDVQMEMSLENNE